MNEIEYIRIGYIAGILDGEGAVSFHARKGNKGQVYATPSIQVVNINKELIEWLRKEFGGYIQSRIDLRLNRRPSYCWFIAGEKVRILLRIVLPYLIVKKKQAELILELDNIQRPLRPKISGIIKSYPDSYHSLTRDAVFKMRILNKRGNPLFSIKKERSKGLISDKCPMAQ